MKNKKLKMLIRTCSILTSIAVFTGLLLLHMLKILLNHLRAQHQTYRMNYPI